MIRLHQLVARVLDFFFIVMPHFSSFSLMLRKREVACCHYLNAYNIANPIEDSIMAAFG